MPKDIDSTRFIKTKIQNKTYLNGQHMKIYEFQRNHKKRITREEMINISEKMKEDFQNKYGHGIMSISIKYPNRWYSSNVNYLQEQIHYFTMDDYDIFDDDPQKYFKFRVNFIPIVPLDEGGLDPHNDCLVNCIRKFIINPYQKGMIKAEDIKEYLNLGRDDMISIDMISKVEQFINNLLRDKYAIMVSGDAEYISNIKSNKIIKIILSKKHYSLDKTINKVKGKAYNEKKILMYEYNKMNDNYDTFNGEEVFIITKDEYKEYNDNPITSPYLLVGKAYINKVEDLPIEEAYKSYIKMANIMKEKTDGRINFYKTGTIKRTALNYFYDMVKTVQPDPISNNEAKWIEDTTFGALTYWEQYKGNVYMYDKNSHYPSILKKNFHYFPIKEGEYLTMNEKDFNEMYSDDFKDYSIYRCIIEKSKDKSTKFFRFNQKNKYTHLDLQCAKEYGLNIKLIVDGKPNCLYYSKDKLMNGAYLFKKYVDELYELKIQKIDGAKDLLNILWGALCEMNYNNRNIDYDDEINYTEVDIRKITTSEDNIQIKCLFYKASYFKTNFGRMKPFIISYGRKCLFRTFIKYEPLIVRLHTDGIYLKEKLTEFDNLDTNKIGYMKYEGMKEVNIKGLNKVK